MSHFDLDVDPWQVRTAATRLASLQGDLTAAAAGLVAVLPQVQASWTGHAATALSQESSALVKHATAAAEHFADAGTALTALADVYDEAVTVDLVHLNHAWEAALQEHAHQVSARQQQDTAYQRASDAARAPRAPGAAPAPPLPTRTAPPVAASDAVLAAAQAALEARFDDLHDRLRAATRRTGGDLAAATVVPVPPALASAYAAGGPVGALIALGGAGRGVFALQGSLPLTALVLAGTAPLPYDSSSLGTMLDQARALGLPPTSYAQLLEAYWAARAAESAGVDFATWDPSQGAQHNRETILRVYEYYGQLYRDHPELEWAGLANLVGPGFAASFFDLGLARDVAGALAELPDLPAEQRESLDALAGASDAQLEFYETTFLTMQQNIFRDMGSMHEAYLDGGLARIEEMRAAGLIDRATLQTWQAIDRGRATGDRELLHQGAYGLAHREQFDIIGDDWDAMRDHPPIGEQITYVFTAVGKPSVPGARFPGEVSPVVVPLTPKRVPVYDPGDLPLVPGLPFVDLPDEVTLPAQARLRTSLPDFNVADRNQRWDYFTADTLPRYLELLDEGAVHDLTLGDMEQRIAEQRSLYRSREILAEHDPRDWEVVVE